MGEVAAALNHVVAAERGVQFRVLGWRTDVRARVHPRGPQGPIDEDLPIEKCDIVIGILWKRFGTPMPQMGGETGTEHEIRGAIAASARQAGKPEVVICFNDAAYTPDLAEWRADHARSEVSRRDLRGRLASDLRWRGGFSGKDPRLVGAIPQSPASGCAGKSGGCSSRATQPATSTPCATKRRTSTCKASNSATTARTGFRLMSFIFLSPLPRAAGAEHGDAR